MSKETLVEKLRGYKSTPRHCEELCYEAANEIESLRQQLADMTVDRDELLASQWIAVRGAAELAIEKCKNSTGQRRVIDLYVSPNQCAEDILDAIKAAKEQGK